VWFVALIFFYGFMVAQTLLKRTLAQSSHVPAVLPPFIAYLFGLMPVSVLAGLVLLDHQVQWSGWLVFLLVVQGSLIGVFNWLSFHALKYLPAAHFQTVFQMSSIVIIVLGWLLLSEKLSLMQIGGALLIFVSALLAIWAPMRAHRQSKKPIPHLRTGLTLALISTLAMGVGLVTEKAALQYMDIGAYFVYGFGAQTLGLGVLAAPQLTPKTLRTLTRPIVQQATVLGLLSAGVGFSYIYAIQAADNISLVTALKAFALPVLAIAAHYVLRERDDGAMLWTAIALGVVGMVITVL
jgi:drug/metabolite transporter (DMT)-like permease